MSNQTERNTLGELLFREFTAYAAALTEHGEDWSRAWHSATWPPHTPLGALQGRFAVAREAAGSHRREAERQPDHRRTPGTPGVPGAVP